MMEENNDWATPTLKEVYFWRDDMGPEEYEVEREYMAKNRDKVRESTYVPLWKQKQERASE